MSTCDSDEVLSKSIDALVSLISLVVWHWILAELFFAFFLRLVHHVRNRWSKCFTFSKSVNLPNIDSSMGFRYLNDITDIID
jgi:hypothetical protein